MTIQGLTEELWIEMYQRGFVEEEDVALVQSWLGDLARVGYRFPPVRGAYNSTRAKEVEEKEKAVLDFSVGTSVTATSGKPCAQ